MRAARRGWRSRAVCGARGAEGDDSNAGDRRGGVDVARTLTICRARLRLRSEGDHVPTRRSEGPATNAGKRSDASAGQD